jgi:hypothetical protein
VTPSGRPLAEFERYLLRDRGLADLSVQGYQRVARSFPASCFEEGIVGLERLTAADVTHVHARADELHGVGRSTSTETQ